MLDSNQCTGCWCLGATGVHSIGLRHLPGGIVNRDVGRFIRSDRERAVLLQVTITRWTGTGAFVPDLQLGVAPDGSK